MRDGYWAYASQSVANGTQVHYANTDQIPINWGGTCPPPPFSNALTLLPPDATAGQTASTSTTVNCVAPDSSVTSTLIEYTATIVGIESITVPLGTFSDALHVHMERTATITVPDNSGAQLITKHTDELWFARNLGLAKADFLTESTVTGSEDPPLVDKEKIALEYTDLIIGNNGQKDDGHSCTSIADPINYASGNHYQTEVDYQGTGLFPIKLERFYNSRAAKYGEFGLNWRYNYVASAGIIQIVPPYVALVYRPDGKLYAFKQNGSIWTSDGDVNGRLTTDTIQGKITNVKYTTQDGDIESYDDSGKLLSIRSRAGMTHTLTYDPNTTLLSSVQDQFGNTLTFNYDPATGRLSSVTDPAGQQIVYAYDDINRLTQVTYQDGKTKKYNYNEPSNTGGADLPQVLTSILDENNNVYASWHYDSQGRAVSAEHTNGTEKVFITYNADGTRTITDSLNKSRIFSPTSILGASKNTGLSDACNTCSDGRIAHKTYDANGNVTSRTDFNGNVTSYTYDTTRNLETSRTEASGTPQARTISTKWDSTYRLPVQIAEPLRLTTLTYSSTTGNLLTASVIATTDQNGSLAFSAQTAGIARIWTYTYDQWGQKLTVTGPRTDVVDKTSFTYDAKGHVATITNALGKVTTLSNYDALGHAGTIVDQNGVTTTLLYNQRGWLTSRSVSGGGLAETTTYGYDGAGQLTLITLPDASTVAYTYDGAHRLTRIADSLGNSIAYTLDSMGNRISVQVNDPSGVLARQTTRAVDPLNQVQQITGAVQ